MATKLYRITARRTGSKQPGGGTSWQREVLYCGPDRDEARVVYHTSTVSDFGGSFGNSARETICETIDDDGSNDFDDDGMAEYEVE